MQGTGLLEENRRAGRLLVAWSDEWPSSFPPGRLAPSAPSRKPENQCCEMLRTPSESEWPQEKGVATATALGVQLSIVLYHQNATSSQSQTGCLLSRRGLQWHFAVNFAI